MLQDKIQLANEQRAQLAALEADIATELKTELAALPGKFGFKTADELRDGVLKAQDKRIRPKAGFRPVKARKQPTKITDAIRDEVMKRTAAHEPIQKICKDLDIGPASVANVRRERAPKTAI